jgi:hypothetical protein
MKDETYLFISDSREKKSVARSAAKRVTHGGAVRFPSDYMTKKELNAMNGEVISYPMNDPLPWREFKALPDDIKVLYIKALRERYNVPVLNIAEMMGIHPTGLRKELARLNISGKRGIPGEWDKEGFYAWAHCVPVQKAAKKEERATKGVSPNEEAVTEGAVEKVKAVPSRGEMQFRGKADEALEAVMAILGGAAVTITVAWNTLTEEGCEGIGNG